SGGGVGVRHQLIGGAGKWPEFERAGALAIGDSGVEDGNGSAWRADMMQKLHQPRVGLNGHDASAGAGQAGGKRGEESAIRTDVPDGRARLNQAVGAADQ